jgi:hypothetical protein
MGLCKSTPHLPATRPAPYTITNLSDVDITVYMYRPEGNSLGCGPLIWGHRFTPGQSVSFPVEGQRVVMVQKYEESTLTGYEVLNPGEQLLLHLNRLAQTIKAGDRLQPWS